MTMTANSCAPWTVGSTPPTLPLQRGGKRRPFFLGSLVSHSFWQQINEQLQSPLAVAGTGLLVCVSHGNWHCRASQRRQIDDL